MPEKAGESSAILTIRKGGAGQKSSPSLPNQKEGPSDVREGVPSSSSPKNEGRRSWSVYIHDLPLGLTSES